MNRIQNVVVVLLYCTQTEARCICADGYTGPDCSSPTPPPISSYTPLLDPAFTSPPSSPSLARSGHSLVACYDGALYMFGGYSAGYGVMNDLWKYDPVADEWTQLYAATTEEPEPRFVNHSFIISSVFILFQALVHSIPYIN